MIYDYGALLSCVTYECPFVLSVRRPSKVEKSLSFTCVILKSQNTVPFAYTASTALMLLRGTAVEYLWFRLTMSALLRRSGFLL